MCLTWCCEVMWCCPGPGPGSGLQCHITIPSWVLPLTATTAQNNVNCFCLQSYTIKKDIDNGVMSASNYYRNSKWHEVHLRILGYLCQKWSVIWIKFQKDYDSWRFKNECQNVKVVEKMKTFQLLFSIILLSEVLSIIDKRVINNKNSDNNEGKNCLEFIQTQLVTHTFRWKYFSV